MVAAHQSVAQQAQKLPPWKEGQLDIYQISTGMGNASFCILPDGTTLLIEAGAINEEYARAILPIPHPNADHSPAVWISRFIQAVMPPVSKKQIDFALLTHFHDDHMGAPNSKTPNSTQGNYKLTGISEVGEMIQIRKVIDRGWPDYIYPSPLNSAMVDNYRRFLNWQIKNNGLVVEKFQTGRNDQITLMHQSKKYSDFEVRNIASNGDIWTGKGQNAFRLFPELNTLAPENYPNENACSNVLKITYGKFNYFNGGDIFGIPEAGKPEWFNVEDPISRIVGQVDVQVVNHHGYKDSQTETFIKNLQPQVFILPAWASVHPDSDVLNRMLSEKLYPGKRDIFITSLLKESAIANQESLSKLKSTEGHVLVRVEAGGKKFNVIIIDHNDESFRVKQVFGPYTSR